MTTEQHSTESEASEELKAATREYELGNAILDILESETQLFEEHVARADKLSVDDLRRLPEHLIRAGKLTLRIHSIYEELNRQIFASLPAKKRRVNRGGH